MKQITVTQKNASCTPQVANPETVRPTAVRASLWPRLFIASFIAQVVFGVILGLLAERWVRAKGTILALLKHDDLLLGQTFRHRQAEGKCNSGEPS